MHVIPSCRVDDTADLTPEDIAFEARKLWYKSLMGYHSSCLRGSALEFSWNGLRAAERNLRFYGSSGAVGLANEIASLLRLPKTWAPEICGALPTFAGCAEQIAGVASNCDREWCASDHDRLPLGVCMLIWLVLSVAMWGGIVGLGLLVFA